MESEFRVPVDDSSAESLELQEKEVPLNSGTGNHGPIDETGAHHTPTALLALNNGSHAKYTNLQLHEHTSLFYLSLIEGRCGTQAANFLNKGRPQDQQLPEHHPEVRSLAQHLFHEMTAELRRAGVLPNEFAASELSELRQNYLSAFDTILLDKAAKKAHESPQNNTYSSLFDRSNNHEIAEDRLSTSAATDTEALALQRYTMAPGMLSTMRSASDQATSYRNQYRQESLLGKGGFGKVYKATHALDGRAYAIKKVVMRVDGDSSAESKAKDMMSEIRVLSAMNHRNIVRYHHCWIEKLLSEIPGDSSSGSESDEETDAVLSQISNSEFLTNTNFKKELAKDARRVRQMTRMQGDTDDGVIFANSVSASATSGKLLAKKSFFRIPQEDSSSSSKDVVDTGASLSIGDSGDRGYSIEDIPRATDIVPKAAVFDIVLFIQMSLHPMNLEEYLWPELRKREKAELAHCYHCLPTARILLSILDGVDYIHRHNIIHRDLKPPNIMLSISRDKTSLLDGSIKISDCPHCSDSDRDNLYITPHIGDFGLVADIEDPEASVPTRDIGILSISTTPRAPPIASTATFPDSANFSSQNRIAAAPTHTSGLGLSSRQPGTRFYVAPKPSQGKNIVCPKLDVYSLGVIAFEMIYTFATKSERAVELDKLKNGIYPEKFEKLSMAPGIKKMLCRQREQRWGCAEVREWLNTIIETESALLKGIAHSE